MHSSSNFLRLSFIFYIITPFVSARGINNRPGPDLWQRSPPAPVQLEARQQPQGQSQAPVSFEFYPDSSCASYCLPTKNPSDDYIGCPPITIPCKKDPSKKCTGVDHACFCTKPRVLNCAWYCDWFEWFKVEDWYSDECPEVPKINYDGLPACARECLIDELTAYGCVSNTRNCFCTKQYLFGCPDRCDPGDKQKILSWFGEQCLLNPEQVSALELIDPASATAAAVTFTPSADSTGDAAKSTLTDGPGSFRPTRRKLKWYEIYGLIMFLVTGIFVSTVYFFVFKAEYKIHRKRKQELEISLDASRNAVRNASISVVSPLAEKRPAEKA
ncbi:hypothetical protein ABW20_dc0100597 [Dactylellina cionopaga]|nr:hypothetical protein ABW20_dc0100597 [Dactylellina cionopaga]